MFRQAYAIASEFTLPVVLSRKTVRGNCTSAIGAFVVVNEDGWIATAAHILTQLVALEAERDEGQRVKAEKESIKKDKSINAKTRKIRLTRLKKIKQSDTDRFSVWWGRDGVNLVDAAVIEAVDIGVGRLEPFDSSLIRQYPVFKDPTKDFEPGASLCKLGFPFHSITPRWDDNKGVFELPPGAIPLPRFPLEGIFTRVVDVKIQGVSSYKYPLRYVETSSPGLRGQSGGPIFDVQGSIWAIQSSTAHYHLGFSPEVPGTRTAQKEHQFLNVGLGTHVETILGLFDEHDITCQVSSY